MNFEMPPEQNARLKVGIDIVFQFVENKNIWKKIKWKIWNLIMPVKFEWM